MSAQKTRIWHKYESVPADRQIQGNHGSYGDCLWMQEMMTEEFGPHGKGWGLEVLEQKIIDGYLFVLGYVWYQNREQRIVTSSLRPLTENGQPCLNVTKTAYSEAISNAISRLGFGSKTARSMRAETQVHHSGYKGPPSSAHTRDAHIKSQIQQLAQELDPALVQRLRHKYSDNPKALMSALASEQAQKGVGK